MSGDVIGNVSGEYYGDVGRGRLDQASPAMSTDMKESPAMNPKWPLQLLFG